MHFVSLAAILAALGLYGLWPYASHPKPPEATGYYNASDATQPTGAPEAASRAMRHFPPPSRTSVPADPSDVRGKCYQSAMADWTPSPWRELHFSIPQPQFYAYSFDSGGNGQQAIAAAVAHGDLDGDGVTSTFRLSVTVDDKLTAQVSPTLERISPEE
jgi:hypothetical protein